MNTPEPTPGVVPNRVMFSGTIAGNDLEAQIADMQASARGQLAMIAALVLKFGKIADGPAAVTLSLDEQKVVKPETQLVFTMNPTTGNATLIVQLGEQA